MADHIKIELDALDKLANDLETLYNDMHDVPDVADQINDSIGSSTVRGAMDNFANNWKTRRGKLLKSMDSVQKMAAQSHAAFSDADQKLADSVLGKKS